MITVRKDGRGVEAGPRGQVLVEVLLILPIFMFLVFSIMEIGHLSFRTILLNHCAYEAARVASISSNALPQNTCVAPDPNWGKVQVVVSRILPGARLVKQEKAVTLVDPQEGCPNYEVVVGVQQNVQMIFPMTGLILGNADGRRSRTLVATVRMPIERPLFK